MEDRLILAEFRPFRHAIRRQETARTRHDERFKPCPVTPIFRSDGPGDLRGHRCLCGFGDERRSPPGTRVEDPLPCPGPSSKGLHCRLFFSSPRGGCLVCSARNGPRCGPYRLHHRTWLGSGVRPADRTGPTPQVHLGRRYVRLKSCLEEIGKMISGLISGLGNRGARHFGRREQAWLPLPSRGMQLARCGAGGGRSCFSWPSTSSRP